MTQWRHEEFHGHRWGLRVGVEMVAATMIGLGLGFMLDRWLHTRPLFLLVFFTFGAAAGFLNLYHVMRLDRQERHRNND